MRVIKPLLDPAPNICILYLYYLEKGFIWLEFIAVGDSEMQFLRRPQLVFIKGSSIFTETQLYI